MSHHVNNNIYTCVLSIHAIHGKKSQLIKEQNNSSDLIKNLSV